jgi:hypothetical protein
MSSGQVVEREGVEVNEVEGRTGWRCPRDHKQDCISFRSIRGSLDDAVGTFRLGDGYQNGFTRVSIVAMRYVGGGYALFTSRVLT